MTSDETHIIVGGGLAGAKAAETLHEEVVLRQRRPLVRAFRFGSDDEHAAVEALAPT